MSHQESSRGFSETGIWPVCFEIALNDKFEWSDLLYPPDVMRPEQAVTLTPDPSENYLWCWELNILFPSCALMLFGVLLVCEKKQRQLLNTDDALPKNFNCYFCCQETAKDF